MRQSLFSGAILVLLGIISSWSTAWAQAAAPVPGAVRYQESNSAIVYSAGWIADSAYGAWSGGSAKYTVDMGAHATFTFAGTGVSWIGYRGRYGGIVLVFIDDALAAALDTYTATEEISAVVYTVRGLAPGTHRLKVQLSGARNPFAVNSETAVDAFDVFP